MDLQLCLFSLHQFESLNRVISKLQKTEEENQKFMKIDRKVEKKIEYLRDYYLPETQFLLRFENMGSVKNVDYLVLETKFNNY